MHTYKITKHFLNVGQATLLLFKSDGTDKISKLLQGAQIQEILVFTSTFIIGSLLLEIFYVYILLKLFNNLLKDL